MLHHFSLMSPPSYLMSAWVNLEKAPEGKEPAPVNNTPLAPSGLQLTRVITLKIKIKEGALKKKKKRTTADECLRFLKWTRKSKKKKEWFRVSSQLSMSPFSTRGAMVIYPGLRKTLVCFHWTFPGNLSQTKTPSNSLGVRLCAEENWLVEQARTLYFISTSFTWFVFPSIHPFIHALIMGFV